VDYTRHTFAQLRAERAGLIEGNREFRRRIRELGRSDPEETDNMYRSIDWNESQIAEIDAEIENRRSRRRQKG
jgi:hypothetical protein